MTDTAPYFAAPHFAALDATWPAARRFDVGGVTVREGLGGGSRVSAATANAALDDAALDAAEQAMRDIGQTPRFMLRPHEDALDAQLAQRGYVMHDPTVLYTMPITRLTQIPIPRVTTFCIWEPLAIMAEIWAKGGIGPERLAVMGRAAQKTAILARWNEKPAGAGFVGLHEHIAMVHAVEVLPHQRRQGVAQWIMRQAAFWGQLHGADTLALLTTKDNTGANALYRNLGFGPAGGYHYRAKMEQ
ncbi:GNAT family N-acetyltransferase [Ascidiaceihabitans sp.]|uniref:GNAT family N-acetyltransferase n=1 Tax=Ascidiaceihabitans sp. TaxID=1872644 RepID=UPI003299BA0A